MVGRWCWGPLHIGVRADDPLVAARLGRLLAGLESAPDAPPPAEGCRLVEVVVRSDPWPHMPEAPNTRHRLFIDDVIHVQSEWLWQVEDALLGQLNAAALDADAARLHLHAALVSRDGCGVMLLGASGSGKSTLATHLGRSGWTLHGDEMVAVLRDGRVQAFPRPPTLKRGAWPLFADLPSVPDADGEDPARDRAHVPFDELALGGQDHRATVSVVALVFVRFGPGESRLAPLDPAGALARLVADTLDLERAGTAGFGAAVGLADGLAAHELVGGPLQRSASMLDELVSGSRSASTSARRAPVASALGGGGLWWLGDEAVAYDQRSGALALVDRRSAERLAAELDGEAPFSDDATDVEAVHAALARVGVRLEARSR